MYVVMNVPHADRYIRLHYTRSETVQAIDELQHELAREALRFHRVEHTIEISSLADLPAGTGLGSSSCYLVGLLNALRAYTLKPVHRQVLAEEACHIELNVLKKPIGKQDQYMAVYGGLTELTIERSGRVTVRPMVLSPHDLSDFVSNTHLYYTSVQRNTTDILQEQTQTLRTRPSNNAVEDSLLSIRDIGYAIGEAMRNRNFDKFGELMHEHWLLKRRMSQKITLSTVEALYDHVRAEYGVLGGKIVGAGGGGFLMLYCPTKSRELARFMQDSAGMSRLYYGPEFEGSRVIANTLKSYSGHVHGATDTDQGAATA
jgi:D-glycero-alpha-D-manno-heptose-7-phosphate kinase